MKSLHIISTFFLIAPISLSFCQSQNETYIADEIAKIPACGVACLEITIPAVGCDLLNTTCQCSSQRLIKITAQCMMANCTLEESVELDKVQAAICERPYQSRNHLITVASIVCMTITYTAVAVRLITRYFLHQNYRLDDWFIIGAACSDAVFTGFGIAFEHHGFGEHVWEINVNMIPQLLYWFYLCEVFYVITISLIKVSILTFYLQVFPTRSFRIQCWSVMTFCVLSSVAFTIVTIFQCHPLSYVWNKNLRGGKCINFNSVTWANGALNILQDLLIVALPISEVRKLQLGLKKKIGLYIMFGLGGFVCVTSMVRLYTLKTFGLTADATWDNVPITFWTTLETTTAVLCTCLPTIRAGLLRLFPQVFGSTIHPSTATTTTSNKPTITYQKSFGTSSIAKSWPAQKLTSISSLSIRDDETQSTTNHNEVVQDLELAKLNPRRFWKE